MTSKPEKPATHAQLDELFQAYVDGLDTCKESGAQENVRRSNAALVEYLNSDEGRDASPRVRTQLRALLTQTALGRMVSTAEAVESLRRSVEQFERAVRTNVHEQLRELPPDMAEALARLPPKDRELVTESLIDTGVSRFAGWLRQMDDAQPKSAVKTAAKGARS